MLFSAVLIFAITWWFGLYLLSRYEQTRHSDVVQNPNKIRLKYVAYGMMAYAWAVIGTVLADKAPTVVSQLWIQNLSRSFLFLPALFWLGAVLSLWPDSWVLKEKLELFFKYAFPIVTILIFILTNISPLIFNDNQPGQLYWVLIGGISILLLLNLFFAITASYQARGNYRQPVGWAAASTLFFALSIGLILFPLGWLPTVWIILGMGGDFIVLGLVIAFLDAFDEGETLRFDMFHSLILSGGAALLFGGQVVFVMVNSGNSSFNMWLLLVSTIATAMAIITFADQIQLLFDKIIFVHFPKVQQTRSSLRSAVDDVARLPANTPLLQIEEEEFGRLTRRALSHMGNLPRLANSPLIDLPLIDSDLTTLEKASQLKLILTESITRLKPPTANGTSFASTEEWRFYNALYFPYVVGLKPYSRRTIHDDLDRSAEEALEWFQQQVPERTLYNWQKAAAELIAQDLRELINQQLH